METTKKIPVPTLALQGKWDSINIGVGVIAALGMSDVHIVVRNSGKETIPITEL